MRTPPWSQSHDPRTDRRETDPAQVRALRDPNDAGLIKDMLDLSAWEFLHLGFNGYPPIGDDRLVVLNFSSKEPDRHRITPLGRAVLAVLDKGVGE